MSTVTKLPIAEPRVELIRLEKIHESASNPRQSFDPVKLQELADDITRRGVLQPVLVRPRPSGGFELVFGARRYRAAKLAKLETLLCIVREMTDEQVLETQLVENAKRVAGWRALAHVLLEFSSADDVVQRRGWTNEEEIAAKIDVLKGGELRGLVFELAITPNVNRMATSAADCLRQWRESAGINQAELARRLRVSAPSVSDWEAGKKTPRIEHALAIAAESGGAVPIETWARVDVPATGTEDQKRKRTK